MTADELMSITLEELFEPLTQLDEEHTPPATAGAEEGGRDPLPM
jgi:hypothetical protein